MNWKHGVDFYIPAAIGAVVILFSGICFLLIKVANIYNRIAYSEKAIARRSKKKLKMLEEMRYIEIELDGEQVMCHPDIAYSKDSEVDLNDKRIFRIDKIDSYSYKELEEGKRTQNYLS